MQSSNTPGLRYALIGCAAGIAPLHLRALQQTPGFELVGMCDVNADAGAARATEFGSAFFADHRQLLDRLQPEVVAIVTPHPFHAPLALDASAAGAHVLVEKPMAVTVAEADAMIDAAQRAGRLLAVNFQQRFRPAIEQVRAWIDAGGLGPLVRTLSVEPWFRPAAYYRSATWRGTWAGEGGGLLMNQAPHTLDLLCHLAGMPARVWGCTRTRAHAIEVEDTAQAMLEYPNGALGYLTASTAEAGPARLEVVGDHGALELAQDRLTLRRFSPSLREHMATSTEMFSAPEIESESFEPQGDGGGHTPVYRDFHAAITQGRLPRADGREGRMSLELANAITYSSLTERPVDLPLDRAAYDELLADLRVGRRRLSS